MKQEHPHECCHHENHAHHHQHEHDLHRQLGLIGVSTVLLAGAVAVEKATALTTWQLLLVYLVPYLIVGASTLKEAIEGLLEGEPFNEHFLMTIATIGALCIGFLPGAETEFPEAVFVMLFFQVGELFEGYAEGKSRESIAHLMDIRPDTARLAGQEQTVSPEEVAVGSIIEIRPGEKVPLDGVVVSGTSPLNTMALTGESVPREVAEGDDITSGCVNLNGVLRVRTTKAFGESTVSKIIRLVEDASEHKSQSETFITRFARIYTPIVVFAAMAIAVLPPLYLTLVVNHTTLTTSHFSLFTTLFPTWLYRALIFLIVSCPCALVISVPLTFFGGIGGAAREGILVKGANYLDVLSKTDTVVFDKTGTLTHGRFAVEAVHPDLHDEHRLLHLAAHVEHYSTHPIGAALRDAFPEEATDGCQVSDVEEVTGKGIRAKVSIPDAASALPSDYVVCVGNAKMMDAVGVKWHDCHDDAGTVIHVAIGETYAGHIVVNDVVKEDSRETIAALKALGIQKTVMLTGDRKAVARQVAQQLGIDEWHAELLPADKVEALSAHLVPHANQLSKVAFVGDGINDAPVLARADVGIAMGALGSDAAIEAADVVLMDDHPLKIVTAIRIARRTLTIARQNIWFAIGVKAAVLVLAAVGMTNMGMAVFADVGVTVLAVLNAIRALNG